jgi:hypothetical protein
MSISAVGGVSPSTQQPDQPQTVTPAPAVTPFSQQLDAEGTQANAASPHHHHHHGGGSQSVTSSAATAASAAGVAPTGSIASSILNLLS